MGEGISPMETQTLSPEEAEETLDSTPQRSGHRGGLCLLPGGPRQQWGQELGGRGKGPAGATGTDQPNLGSEK